MADTEKRHPGWWRRRLGRSWTLRARLLVALLILSAVGLTAVGAASVLLLRYSLISRVDQQLHQAAHLWANGSAGVPPRDYHNRRGVPTNFRVFVIEPNGTVDNVLGQPPDDAGGPVLPPLNSSVTALGTGGPFTVPDEAGGSSWQVMVVGAPDGHVIAVALSLADADAAIYHLLDIELAVSGLVLALLGVVATVVVRLGLRPLTRIEHTAAAIARGELDARVEGAGDRTETGRLAAALNIMLARISSALRERQRSQQRLRSFLSDASHELRTPLTSIRGFAELYRRGGASEKSDVDSMMARIEGEAGRMGRLVEDLLLLARMDEERALDLTEVDLLVLASDAVQDAHAREPGRPVTLTAPSGTQRILGDEHRLRQVITNLLSNALVHTPPGTPVRVRIDRLHGDDTTEPAAFAGEPPHASMVSIEVSDDGSGVSADQAPQVFDRFYRAGKQRSSRRSGSGLGLAIAAAIVQAHQGRIELLCTPGTGAHFRVLLPEEWACDRSISDT